MNDCIFDFSGRSKYSLQERFIKRILPHLKYYRKIGAKDSDIKVLEDIRQKAKIPCNCKYTLRYLREICKKTIQGKKINLGSNSF